MPPKLCPLYEMRPCQREGCAWWWDNDCSINHAAGAFVELIRGGLPLKY